MTPGTRLFREPFDALRRQLDTRPAAAVIAAARDRHPVLCDNSSVEMLLSRMADESAPSWADREALTRAFLAEHQRDASRGVWSALLLLAYFPMLSHLRFRLGSETLDSQDLDSLVISRFLEVIATLNLNAVQNRTAMHLRQRTQRKVFRVLRRASTEHRRVTATSAICAHVQEPAAEEPPRPSDTRDPEQTVAQLLDVAGQELPPDQLDVVVATMLRKERLRSYAQRCAADGEPTERVYQRLKRRRARALERLRGLIARSQRVAGDDDASTPA